MKFVKIKINDKIFLVANHHISEVYESSGVRDRNNPGRVIDWYITNPVTYKWYFTISSISLKSLIQEFKTDATIHFPGWTIKNARYYSYQRDRSGRYFKIEGVAGVIQPTTEIGKRS